MAESKSTNGTRSSSVTVSCSGLSSKYRILTLLSTFKMVSLQSLRLYFFLTINSGISYIEKYCRFITHSTLTISENALNNFSLIWNFRSMASTYWRMSSMRKGVIIDSGIAAKKLLTILFSLAVALRSSSSEKNRC